MSARRYLATRASSRRALALALALASALLCAAPARAEPESATTPPEPDRLLAWHTDDGASWLSLGAWVIDDFFAFPRNETGFGSSWDADFILRAARASVRFRWDWLCGRLDVEISDSNPDVEEAWLDYCGLSPYLGVRAGRFRVPFGLVQQVQTPQLKLLAAPLVAGNSKDFRDIGVELHGTVWSDRIRWAVATVTGSRDISSSNVNDMPDVAGRLTIHPLLGLGPWFEGLHFGGSATWGQGPARNGFRGETMTGYTFATPPTVRGVQWRAAAELAWNAPAFRVAAEFQYINQERDGITATQRIGTTTVSVGDLDHWVVWGWYVEASAHLFGDDDADGNPATGLELAARFETLHFGDGSRLVTTADGDEQHAPLADSWVEGVTGGVNGYLGHGLRVEAAYQGLRYGDATLASDYETGDTATGPRWVHSVFLRAQYEY